MGNDHSLFLRLIRGTLCWVEAPEDGGEQAIAQEMPEMRPFPGRIAELDGYTYPSFSRAEVAFDIVRVMGGRGASHQPRSASASGSASAAQSIPSRSAPDPHTEASPENDVGTPDDEGPEDKEDRRSPDPS